MDLTVIQTLELFFSAHTGFSAVSRSDLEALAGFVEEFLLKILGKVIGDMDDIMGIDPNLDERKILESAAEKIVRAFGADAATIRVLDPGSGGMGVLGAFNVDKRDLLASVPFEDSIAGQVAREGAPVAVQSLSEDNRFKSKAFFLGQGLNSLLSVPLRIPSIFLSHERGLVGAIQLFFRKDHREFSAFDLLHAELLARRLSLVLAKRRILVLEDCNVCKERIASTIFEKLSNREGIKLKDLFVAIIPELERYLHIRSFSFYSISKDLKFIRLEAVYPIDMSYHHLGYTFTVEHHPYFRLAVEGRPEAEDHPYERIDPSYLLIKDPERSALLTPGVRDFVKRLDVHSMLLVPIKVGEVPRYLMSFMATEQKESFYPEEIELLTFLGKEIMKASRMELLDDLVHDFKNPAIAITGFSNRAKKILQYEDLNEAREKLNNYLDVIIRETGRLQDLAVSFGAEGRDELLDLSQVARERYALNETAIQSSGKRHVLVEPCACDESLMVFCPRFSLERVLDNLLNNATKAVPEEGGCISMRCYREGQMACLLIRNSGEIPPDKIEEVRLGNVKGRGLNIIYRFVQTNHGKIDIQCSDRETVFVIKLPLSVGEHT